MHLYIFWYVCTSEIRNAKIHPAIPPYVIYHGFWVPQCLDVAPGVSDLALATRLGGGSVRQPFSCERRQTPTSTTKGCVLFG